MSLLSRRSVLKGGIIAAASALLPSSSWAICTPWASWTSFKQSFIANGRVIDVGSERNHTTSEGQSYALFFALVANDRATFEQLLQWTTEQLAQGDLTHNLPAWWWGKRDDGSMGVLDSNSAADSDLWIAYTLLEAGRLWRERRYTAVGTLLAQQIVAQETVPIHGLGRTLLPAPQGFHPEADVWRLNPSYVPLQVLRRLAVLAPAGDPTWTQLIESSRRVLLGCAPHGFAPEWIVYRTKEGFQADAETHAEGSYNAIRVYLWAGMLAPNDPAFTPLIAAYRPMVDWIRAHGAPPERIDTVTVKSVNGNDGPSGFSAAVVPFLAAQRDVALAQGQALRSEQLALVSNPGYFGQVLRLFGLGWYQRRYRFRVDGQLEPAWATSSCLIG